jgi:hypothetical protein
MRTAVLLGAGLGLCGCADTSVVYHSYYNSAYTPSHVQLAASSGTSVAVIRNDPFPADRDNAGVLAAMQGRTFGWPRMYFSQTPRPDDKYGYKVILDFGSSGYSATYQCKAEPTAPSSVRREGPIAVSAAFCIGDRLLTDAAGSIGEATGPEDPRFYRLIGDIMVALTPPYEPSRGGRCRGRDC